MTRFRADARRNEPQGLVAVTIRAFGRTTLKAVQVQIREQWYWVPRSVIANERMLKGQRDGKSVEVTEYQLPAWFAIKEGII